MVACTSDSQPHDLTDKSERLKDGQIHKVRQKASVPQISFFSGKIQSFAPQHASLIDLLTAQRHMQSVGVKSHKCCQ